MLCIVSDVGISVVLLCDYPPPPNPIPLPLVFTYSTTIDRAISYPPEFGKQLFVFQDVAVQTEQTHTASSTSR